MTSLGSYGTATVLECDTLITNNLRNSNNGLVTSVIGQLKLPSNEPVTNVLSPIKTWILDPSSSNAGISIDNTTGFLSVSKTGVYKVDFTCGFSSSSMSESIIVLFKTAFGGSAVELMRENYIDSSNSLRQLSMSLSYLLTINDIRDTFYIDAYVNGSSPVATASSTFIQIVKVL